MILKIKELRKKKNLSQDDLCQNTGISKRMLTEYENGKSDIPLQKLQSIATFMHVSVSELIGEDEIKPNLGDKDELLKSLNETKEILKEQVKELKKDKELLVSIIEKKL